MKLICLFFVPFLLFFSACQPPFQDKIQGRWQLEIIEYLDADTQQWTPSSWMKNGTGLLEYNPDGRMNVHFTPKAFETMEDPDESEVEVSEMEQFKHLSSDYWYVGDYEIIEDGAFVTHHRVMHSNPWDWGVKVKRKVNFLGDTLILTSTEREVNLRLKWVRKK